MVKTFNKEENKKAPIIFNNDNLVIFTGVITYIRRYYDANNNEKVELILSRTTKNNFVQMKIIYDANRFKNITLKKNDILKIKGRLRNDIEKHCMSVYIEPRFIEKIDIEY